MLFLSQAPPPPLETPPAIVRTAEEMGIEIRPVEPPGRRIVRVAKVVLNRYVSGDHTPSYGSVVFSGASRMGRCQQNVRNLMEAAVYGRSWSWSEAACCASQTRRNLHSAAKRRGKYIEITDMDDLQPGDLVYLSGDSYCSGCGGTAGHVMVFTRRLRNGDRMMWQNTSADGLLLCEVPLTRNQSERFMAAFRLPTLKPLMIPSNPVAKIISERRPKDAVVGVFPAFSSINLIRHEPFGGMMGMKLPSR